MKRIILSAALIFGVVDVVVARPYMCVNLNEVDSEKMKIDIGSDDMTIKEVKFRFDSTENTNGMQVHVYKSKSFEYVGARKMTKDDFPGLTQDQLERVVLLVTGSGIGMVRWGCYELDVKKTKS